MKLLRILPLVALVSIVASFAAAGDGAKTKDLILGKWKYEKTFKEKEDGKTVEIKVVIIVEFTKDGKWLIDSKTNGVNERKEGTYKVLDEKTLETTLTDEKNKIMTNKLTIETLTKTKLVVFDEKTPKMEFERVKNSPGSSKLGECGANRLASNAVKGDAECRRTIRWCDTKSLT
jgi:uncharacterized protein (TIGR03066 family)